MLVMERYFDKEHKMKEMAVEKKFILLRNSIFELKTLTYDI